MMPAGPNLMASMTVPSFQERIVWVPEDLSWDGEDERTAKSLEVKGNIYNLEEIWETLNVCAPRSILQKH
jgi:hypothetical protein